jgi:hypothetical protein
MTLRILVAAALALGAFVPAAADTIGEITYLEGTVQVVREEESLDAKIVKEGLALENLDLLKVGADGQLEVKITSPSAPPTTLRVGPRTQFSIEIGKVGTKQQTTLDLIAGSVAMKVARLTGTQGLRVQTEAAVLGVRGTDFTVTAPTSGNLLVTCDEGEVACTDGKGTTLLAGAGGAIEQRSGGALARLDVAAATPLEQLRREWLERQNAALESDPLKVVAFHARVFDARLSQFDRQFDRMKSWQKTFDDWKQEHRVGVVGGVLMAIIERRKLEADLRKARATLFLLERTWVRLLELKDYCEERGVSGCIGFLRSSPSFFGRLERQRSLIEWRRARVRFWERLFLLRNDGNLLEGGGQE